MESKILTTLFAGIVIVVVSLIFSYWTSGLVSLFYLVEAIIVLLSMGAVVKYGQKMIVLLALAVLPGVTVITLTTENWLVSSIGGAAVVTIIYKSLMAGWKRIGKRNNP